MNTKLHANAVAESFAPEIAAENRQLSKLRKKQQDRMRREFVARQLAAELDKLENEKRIYATRIHALEAIERECSRETLRQRFYLGQISIWQFLSAVSDNKSLLEEVAALKKGLYEHHITRAEKAVEDFKRLHAEDLKSITLSPSPAKPFVAAELSEAHFANGDSARLVVQSLGGAIPPADDGAFRIAPIMADVSDDGGPNATCDD
jgi:hypothetical protein